MSDGKRYCIRNGERVRVQDLRPGDIATMFEPDGTACDGGVAFRVLADPRQYPDGRWFVDTVNLVPFNDPSIDALLAKVRGA